MSNDRIKELEAQLKALKAEQAAQKRAALADVAEDVRDYLKTHIPQYLKKTYPDDPEYHGLTLQDIFTAAKDSRPYHFVNPAKPEETYSGRGQPPEWYSKLTMKQRKACKVYLDEPAEAEEPAPAPAPARPARGRARAMENA